MISPSISSLRFHPFEQSTKPKQRRLPLSVKVGPFPGLNETGPVERMLAAPALQHGQLRLAQRFTPSQSMLQPAVVAGHHLAGNVITHRPQAHDQSFGAG